MRRPLLLPTHRSLLALSAALLLLATAGCAALRQNIRGQELSYRGAWSCEQPNCSAAQMVASHRGRREGTTDIHTVSLQPRVGLAFTAAAAFQSLEATVRDCKGQTAPVPAKDIVAPAKHEVGDQSASESWIIFVDRGAFTQLELGAGACAVWMIEAQASWGDGASHRLVAGIEVEG